MNRNRFNMIQLIYRKYKMNPELHDQLYNLAPYLVLGLMVISGLLISRLRRPEDPFMKGRERISSD